jgi:hypothetical protein
MKTFLAVYTGSDSSANHAAWGKLTEAERNEREGRGMQAWMDWGAAHQAAIAENGGPLGRTKRVTQDGVADIRNNLAGYVVVRAESHEAAAKMFENHPHFAVFPGDGVEIMEVLPIPGG